MGRWFSGGRMEEWRLGHRFGSMVGVVSTMARLGGGLGLGMEEWKLSVCSSSYGGLGGGSGYGDSPAGSR
ncbi:uncharacterized protein G2W53_040949 [Senna tora]|uniref:Uncharacterized protein n=1 Tax=Senna tora TaxID=362788 RepID=A0A834SGJ5_9FABA|nr:uncharacterized protein G2W53_040949 [Senna tora]